MAASYTIEVRYVASATYQVEGNDEGEALDKANELAESADINEFQFCEQLDSRIISRGDG